MKEKGAAGGKRRGNAVNTVVNVAVLLFLGYALLGPGPLGMKIREYTAAREARMAVRDVFARLVTEGRVDSARPTIIEFTDFQCPYCRDMHEVLSRGAAQSEFDLVVMHLPLEQIHPLAKPAAKASLCAEAQRSGDDMNNLLMSTVDWIDDADWVRLARDAGVLDLIQFEECLDASGTEQELARHVAVARQIGVRGTPTFVSHRGIHRGLATVEELAQLAKN